MAVFAPLNVSPSFGGWGPPPGSDVEGPVALDFNVEHLDKFSPSSQQLFGRICDFTVAGMRFQEQRLAKGKGKGKFGKQVLMPKKAADEEGFDIVDSRKLPVKGAKGGGKGGKSKGGKGKIVTNYQEGILGQKQKQVFQAMNAKGKGKGKKGFNRSRGMPSFKDWSVQTKAEWEMKREIMLSALAKAQIDSNKIESEDVMWCGNLRQYDKTWDRVMVRTEKVMSRYESLNFFNVTTSEDPHLPEFMSNDESVTVIATDHVLASLIAAARSVYSWDVVVTKIQGRLIFDKRDGTSLDFLTVNETAQEPPNNDEPNAMNAPLKLGQEASCINQNFSQMVLDHNAPAQQMENGNPFEDEDEPDTTASGAYRYRKITLPGNPKDEGFGQQPVTMVVRTEVNCKQGESYVSTKILNEYDPKATYSWRTHLETQRGAVLATELKNNAFKLGRWTAQAILSGCDVVKLGYASRVRTGDPWSHTILGVQTHYTDNFAEQIGMSRNNAFGIIRSIIDIVMEWEDGKYLILKDPTKSVMRFYEVPADCFDEDDEEEEEMEEEGPELDEDGNVKPERPTGFAGVGVVGRM